MKNIGIALVVFGLGISSSSTLAQQFTSADFELELVDEYNEIWNDRNSGADLDGSFWQPIVKNGYYRLGHHAKEGHQYPNSSTLVISPIKGGVLAFPTSYQQMWNDRGSNAASDVSIWRPICPTEYSAMGDVATAMYSAPALDEVVCVHNSIMVLASVGQSIWTDAGSGADEDFSAWGILAPRDDIAGGTLYLTDGLFVSGSAYRQPTNPPLALEITQKPAPVRPTTKPLIQDLYDYDAGRVVMSLDRKLKNDIADYVTYTKTLPIPRLDIKITATVEVNIKENYYSILLVTPGQKSLKNGGLGYRMGLLPFSDDWNLHQKTQAIYANGYGIDAALKDLETKFNGTDGQIAFSGSGEPTQGDFVLTIEKR